MTLRCVRCGSMVNAGIEGEKDKAGLCITCARKKLTQDQERELEKHGTIGFVARQHKR